MKLQKKDLTQYKLLKVKLIKSNILKKKHYLQNIKIEDIEYRLKKALNIIYFYHINNKRILFVGSPLEINKSLSKVLKNTKHSFIPKGTWLAGIITNQIKSFKLTLYNKKYETDLHKMSKHLLELKKNNDLIVILDQEIDSKALDESYLSRIPTICLNSTLNIFDTKTNYKIPGNFISQKGNLSNNLLFSLLLVILKKSNSIRHKFPVVSHKLNTITKLQKRKYNRYKK